ncbi:RRM domain-containing protein [Aphelenchoides besseyi]|nr:RRM domain-containing protein [Aphelenchoides besseyi]KAI6226837.1 RRM domain-containing protein [Aphelenchoides besseyi]
MSGRYSSSSRRSDGRTSKPEVPISRHSVLFRGFKTDVDIKGVKDYFVDEVGPCTVDSVEKENGMINLALRFESRQDATSCIERFNGQFLFHSKVELSRFRDTRRFVNRYQPTSRCDGNQDSSVRPIYRSRSRERRSADRSRSPVKIVHLNSPSASRDANARCKSLAPVRGPKTPPLTPNGRSATLSDMDISDFEEEINRKIDKQTTPTIEPKKEPPRWKPFSNQEVEKECSVKHNTSASSCSTNTQQSGIDLNVTSNGTNGLSTHEGKSNETVLFGQYLVAVLEQLSGGQRLKLQLRFQQIIYDELYANDESSRI